MRTMPLPQTKINVVEDGEEMENLIISDVSPLHLPAVRQRTWPRRSPSEEIEGIEMEPLGDGHVAGDPLVHPEKWAEFLAELTSPLTSLFYKDGGKTKRLSGWRAGVASCSMLAFAVLVINFVLLVWAVSKRGVHRGYGILYQGDCEKSRQISTGMHILINILSTVLLGASNYTMQCLHSPTRAEVDRAHAQRKWVDIGIPSWRNRRWVSRKDNAMWWLLALSSAPLHLLYNSAVFLDLSAQDYYVSFVSQANESSLITSYTGHSLTNMAWKECSSTFDLPVIFDFTELILVTPETQNPFANFGDRIELIAPPKFIHPNKFEVKLGSKLKWEYHSNSTAIGDERDFPVISCFAEPIPQQLCKVEFSVPIIVVVIICNLCKVLCMVLTLWYLTGIKFVTLGDAIMDFLESPDTTTNDLCLMSKHDVFKGMWTDSKVPKKWNPVAEETFQAKRFFIVNISFSLFGVVCIAVAIIAGIFSAKHFSNGIGFGESMSQIPALLPITAGSMNNAGGLLANVMIANVPQAFVSLINIFYNGLLTSYLLGDEWSSLASQRQPLRVTAPKGSQKSQYYLTIPYRYGIPVMILSAVFHWLVAESFFIVRVTAFYQGTERLDHSLSSLGYSPLAIALASVVCFLMLLFIDLKARHRSKQAIPFVSFCSAAISAACHPPPDELGLELEPVQWGVVQGAGESIGSWKKEGKDFGHCSFSGRPVAPPIPGYYYA